MPQSTIPSLLLLIFSLLTLLSTAIADTSTALLSMEDSQNPLVRISTSQGEIYLELFPLEAPSNVENFIALHITLWDFKLISSTTRLTRMLWA